ncbi:hypothetical protein [Methanosarcina mazei]|uniref:Uncharacterized protein n=1 Tax=Methanosarcina mazei SarPi TaxID=1434115 RepID=A0A0E3RBA2_METMZ|nr:hypothetical protein [Methanosarcina mazei]AKB63022.1 hypothetical protein MSMAP_3037 [Methanosarcina mazei SarPi]
MKKELTFLKLYHLFLASLLLATLLSPVLFAKPCAAAFIPGNNITLERNGITWDYDEKTTDNEAVLFRRIIDAETGNNDGFVNAWEIRKMEVLLGEKMKKAVEEEPDIKLNSTSEIVELKDIEFWIPEEALGRTYKNSSIINRASVIYGFKEEAGTGTEIWLMGTPDSNVTITLPSGFDAERIEGLNNKSLGFENKRTVLKGNFNSEKNITLWLSENESFKAELQDIEANENKSAENESGTVENSTLNTGDKSESGSLKGFFKKILKKAG